MCKVQTMFESIHQDQQKYKRNVEYGAISSKCGCMKDTHSISLEKIYVDQCIVCLCWMNIIRINKGDSRHQRVTRWSYHPSEWPYVLLVFVIVAYRLFWWSKKTHVIATMHAIQITNTTRKCIRWCMNSISSNHANGLELYDSATFPVLV